VKRRAVVHFTGPEGPVRNRGVARVAVLAKRLPLVSMFGLSELPPAFADEPMNCPLKPSILPDVWVSVQAPNPKPPFWPVDHPLL